MLGGSGRKRCRGSMSRRRMDVGIHFECKGNGSGEFGGWVGYRDVILGHD